jgi:hypothetical protein
MVTIHAQFHGDKALVDRQDLDRLLTLARRTEQVELRLCGDDDVPTRGLMELAQQGGSFDFWNEPGEEIYTSNDGEAV